MGALKSFNNLDSHTCNVYLFALVRVFFEKWMERMYTILGRMWGKKKTNRAQSLLLPVNSSFSSKSPKDVYWCNKPCNYENELNDSNWKDVAYVRPHTMAKVRICNQFSGTCAVWPITNWIPFNCPNVSKCHMSLIFSNINNLFKAKRVLHCRLSSSEQYYTNFYDFMT